MIEPEIGEEEKKQEPHSATELQDGMIIPESSVTELRSMALVAQIEGGLSSVIRPTFGNSWR